jgi:carbon monoxide dehydrogenase subunit G
MAMTMNGEVALPASKAVVWAKLNDAEVLKACIPGCDQLTKDDETHFSAIVKVKLGPVKATFRGKVELVDLDPPNGYRIQGEGEGGIAGFAKGGAKVTLSEIDERQTLLHYDVEAQVGGKLMQLGARLIDSVSKKLADEFFANFAKAVSEAETVK